jgi:hypothetical protein
MANQELLTQNPTEQAVNQITVAEKSTSRLQTTVDAMKKLGAMRIEIPDSLKKKAKGVVLASTLAVSGAFMLGNPDKAFAQTQGDAPKVEQGQNVEMFNSNELPDGSQALKDFQAYRVSHPKINAIIEKSVKDGKGALIRADMIPQEFRNAVVKTQTELNSQPNRTVEQPSQPTRTIEQPIQPVQTPKKPSNDGFPFLPLAIVGAAAIGGAAFYKGKLQEGLSGNKKEPKRYKGKGNEQFGMPNKDPDGTNSLEMADRIAEQKLKLKQTEQAELTALQDLKVLEYALEESVKDGMRPNSIAYRQAKAEIDQKKKEFDKKYLS